MPTKKLEAKPEEIQAVINKGDGMKDKVVPVLVVLVIAAAFAVGLMYGKLSVYEKGGVSNTAPTTTTTDQAQAQPTTAPVSLDAVKALFNNQAIAFGDQNSKLLFVEFSDPSCPFCHVAAGENPELNKQMGSQFSLKADGGSYVAPVPEMKKLVDEGKASFAYYYFPGHGNGELGAQALYCAFDAGKFWEVHDKLMTMDGYNLLNDTVKNDKANIPQLVKFVGNAMNSKDLTDCLESGKYASRLQDDTAKARELGINGTPGFLINTTPYLGAYSYDMMQSTVDAALKS